MRSHEFLDDVHERAGVTDLEPALRQQLAAAAYSRAIGLCDRLHTIDPKDQSLVVIGKAIGTIS